ncbi:uncharacterized protein [Rutidosis leptorrhynchoides]|uniref:uncharacterized protein n=1 Tax=Rutidosis leptorrhynchoides TaxID=125765 RepID=UPI003A98EE5E
MMKFGAVTSTVHGMMKFPTPAGIATLYAERRRAIECVQINRTTINPIVHEDGSVSPNPEFPDQKIIIGNTIVKETKEKLYKILATNLDVFAWQDSDMTGVPCHIAEHKLGVNPNIPPVCQKKRGMAPDRNKFLREKVKKLVDAGILREVKYQTWVANPVMVRNPDKACPKGNYPLPEIDWKVESVSGYQFKSFLDAFKGNVKAYVDDIVIKSHTEESMLRDTLKTFESLQRVNMKLNTKKCTFGVEEGKFLGHIVTERGIKANSKKIHAIEDMVSPKTKKEVQSLNGKLAALTRFLSRRADRSLPFMRVLKSCLNKKDFMWTEEDEIAFQDIKRLLKELPTLTAPIAGETLIFIYGSVGRSH